MVRNWDWKFNNGRTNVHEEVQSGRPPVVGDDFVKKVKEKICKNRWFTVRVLSVEFRQISKTVLHEIMTDLLNYHKLCSRLIPKMLTNTQNEAPRTLL